MELLPLLHQRHRNTVKYTLSSLRQASFVTVPILQMVKHGQTPSHDSPLPCEPQSCTQPSINSQMALSFLLGSI